MTYYKKNSNFKRNSLPSDLLSPGLLSPGQVLVFGTNLRHTGDKFFYQFVLRLTEGNEFFGVTPKPGLKIAYIAYNIIRLKNDLIYMESLKPFTELKNKNLVFFEGKNLDRNLALDIEERLSYTPDVVAIDPVSSFFEKDNSPENIWGYNGKNFRKMYDLFNDFRSHFKTPPALFLKDDLKTSDFDKYSPMDCFIPGAEFTAWSMTDMGFYYRKNPSDWILEFRNDWDTPMPIQKIGMKKNEQFFTKN